MRVSGNAQARKVVVPVARTVQTLPMDDRAQRSFDELVDEAASVSVDGWDFSWLEGRATEQRPSWGYVKSMGERMGRARAALDVETGGGEVLAAAPRLPPLTVATEEWPPNVSKAAELLRSRAAVVAAEGAALPFRDGVFDLVVSRHPVTTYWREVARVLAPDGRYFSQQVGPASVFELVEYFLGAQPVEVRQVRDPQDAAAAASAAGLDVVDLRLEWLRTEFFDIGAVVYFLRKVIWMVPGFTVDGYRAELRSLHERMVNEGPFVAHTTRFLIEARKPS